MGGFRGKAWAWVCPLGLFAISAFAQNQIKIPSGLDSTTHLIVDSNTAVTLQGGTTNAVNVTGLTGPDGKPLAVDINGLDQLKNTNQNLKVSGGTKNQIEIGSNAASILTLLGVISSPVGQKLLMPIANEIVRTGDHLACLFKGIFKVRQGQSETQKVEKFTADFTTVADFLAKGEQGLSLQLINDVMPFKKALKEFSGEFLKGPGLKNICSVEGTCTADGVAFATSFTAFAAYSGELSKHLDQDAGRFEKFRREFEKSLKRAMTQKSVEEKEKQITAAQSKYSADIQAIAQEREPLRKRMVEQLVNLNNIGKKIKKCESPSSLKQPANRFGFPETTGEEPGAPTGFGG